MSKAGGVWCRLRFNFPFQGCQSVKARIESCYLATPFPSPLLPGQREGGLCRVRLVFEACSAQQACEHYRIHQSGHCCCLSSYLDPTHPPSTSSHASSRNSSGRSLLNLQIQSNIPAGPVKQSQNNPLRPKGGTFCRQNVSFIAEKWGDGWRAGGLGGDTQMEFLFAAEMLHSQVFVSTKSESWKHFILFFHFLSCSSSGEAWSLFIACVRNWSLTMPFNLTSETHRHRGFWDARPEIDVSC